METEQAWDKIKELFGAALERDPSERAAFLARHVARIYRSVKKLSPSSRPTNPAVTPGGTPFSSSSRITWKAGSSARISL